VTRSTVDPAPSAPRWFGAHLRASAVETPDKTALVFEGRSWTYAQLDTAVTRVMEQLRDLGVAKGHRVLMQGLPRPEALILPFAVSRLAAVLVPLHAQAALSEIAGVAEECLPRVAILGAGRPTEVAEHCLSFEELEVEGDLGELHGEPDGEAPAGSDLALIAYTSGTSGRAKGVALTHDNLFWSMQNGLACLPIAEQDVALVATPLAHVAVLAGLPQHTLASRGTVVLAPRFDPGLFIETVRGHGVTAAFAVPTMLSLLAQHPRFESGDLDSLRWVLAGGAPAHGSTTITFLRRGITVINSYGLTEASAGVTYAAVAEVSEHPTSAGRPAPAVELRIVEETGAQAPVDGSGEIWLRGPSIASSYWTPAGPKPTTGPDGWFRTGDSGRVDADGRLELEGRVTDRIVTAGENVDPVEVEHALVDLPGVIDLAVAGTPDDTWGELVTAFVVAEPPPSIDDIRRHLDGKIAKYKWPRRLVLIDAVPRTATGKVQRRRLAELVDAR
jgi:fatty-acyl-CoA synthase